MPTLTEEKIRNFKDILAIGIMTDIKAFGKSTLYVDYHPCYLLNEAEKEIGLDNMTTFPYKTKMTITDSVVEVSEGYGTPTKGIKRK